nr:unnamed protein product [Callosobruchus analis]
MAESYFSRRLVSFQVLGSVYFALLKDDIIREDTYQCISMNFPNLANYICKKVPVPRKSLAERSQAQIAHNDHLNQLFEESEMINDFDDLIQNYRNKINISDLWTIKLAADSKIDFYVLDFSEDLISLTIDVAYCRTLLQQHSDSIALHEDQILNCKASIQNLHTTQAALSSSIANIESRITTTITNLDTPHLIAPTTDISSTQNKKRYSTDTIVIYPDQPVPTAKTIRSIFHNSINRGCINRGCNHRACQNDDEEKPVPEAKVARDVNVCDYAEAALVAKESVSSTMISEVVRVPDRTVRTVLRKEANLQVKKLKQRPKTLLKSQKVKVKVRILE